MATLLTNQLHLYTHSFTLSLTSSPINTVPVGQPRGYAPHQSQHRIQYRLIRFVLTLILLILSILLIIYISYALQQPILSTKDKEKKGITLLAYLYLYGCTKKILLGCKQHSSGNLKVPTSQPTLIPRRRCEKNKANFVFLARLSVSL